MHCSGRPLGESGQPAPRQTPVASGISQSQCVLKLMHQRSPVKEEAVQPPPGQSSWQLDVSWQEQALPG